MIRFFRRSTAENLPQEVTEPVRKPKDQADRLRDLVRDAAGFADQETAPKMPPLIVLAGSKGGVGVTTLTIEIARALAEQGLRTVAVDANLRQPNLGYLAGAPRDVSHTVASIISGKSSAAEAVVTVAENLSVIPGAWASDSSAGGDGMDTSRMLDGLGQLPAKVDAVIVDAGAGHSRSVAPLWKAAQTVLLVGTPDPLSTLGAYATIKLARNDGDRPKVQLLLNRVTSDEQAESVHNQIRQTCLQFLGGAAPLAGFVRKSCLADDVQVVASVLAESLSTSSSAELATLSAA